MTARKTMLALDGPVQRAGPKAEKESVEFG
jgi:hypothetical protein